MATRGPRADTPNRRQAIIAAAFDAFALGGFRGTSIQEIATSVGLSKPGMLHYFSSKEELLLEVLALRESMNAQRDDIHGLDVLAHLQKVVEIDSATPGIIRLYVTVSAEATNPSHPAHEFFKARYVRTTEATARCFREAREAGELRSDMDEVVAAHQVIAVLDGLQLHWLLNPDVDRVAEFDRYIEQFLAVYGTASAAPVSGEAEPPSTTTSRRRSH